MAASMFRKATQIRPRTIVRSLKSQRTASTSSSADSSDEAKDIAHDVGRDPFPLFAKQEVQSLLSRITGYDILKVAGPQLKKMSRPVYKLLTDEELEKEKEEASTRLKHRLQMPPYLNPRQPVRTNLVDDPDLAGFDTSKYVFVDCTFGIKDRHRSVVVRDTDGSLCEASWDLKERVNQIYNPREGRSVMKPKMFEEQRLERMINDKKYVYVLNRACAQFEPDDPDFIRVSNRVYNAVNTTRDYDHLRSTRFFGPMAFYLVWHKISDSLIVDMLIKDLLEDARDVVQLYCLIYDSSSCAEAVQSMDRTDSETILKVYIETEAKSKSDLTAALQACLDRKPRTEKSSSLS